MSRRLVSAPLIAALLGLTIAAPAGAAIRIPDCETIVTWAAKAYPADEAALLRGGQPFFTGAWLLSGFKDAHWTPVFGAPFPETSPDAFAKLVASAEACRREKRPELVRLPQGSPRRNVLTAADTYILRAFRGRRLTAQTAAPELARYKAAYAAHADAIATREAQLRALESLPPAMDSIATLDTMKKDRKLTALGPDHAQHLQRLEAAKLDIADAMVMAAAEEMATFPESLAGLRALIAYRTKARADLSRLKSRKVQDFLRVETERTSALAAAALPEFVAELQAAPASAEGKATVQAAVAALFPQQPLPRNIRAYRKAAAQRLIEIDRDIERLACNATLAKHGLDDDAGTPLLGPGGETSLGAFVCALDTAGLAFSEYKKPGLFGSTHELILQVKAGPTLTLEMEQVEAIKGRPDMLVGTRMKDAVSTKELTVATWQELAAGLTGYTAPPVAGAELLPLAQAKLDGTPQGCVRTIGLQNVTDFPVDLHAGNLERNTVRQFALLGELGLVSIEERPSQNVSYRQYRYTLTAKAEPYFKGKHGLCFARFVAEDIDNISKPFERGGRTLVSGTLEVVPELPDFALDPRFEQAVAGPQQGPLRVMINAIKSGQALRNKVAFVETAEGWKPAD